MLISDVIQNDIINQMDTTVEIVEAGPVIQGAQLVRFKCMRWMKLFDSFFVNGGEVRILGYTIGFVRIEAVAPGLPAGTICNLKKPLFLNGTLSNTKEEWARFELNERNKLPFVWLVSPTYIDVKNDDVSYFTANIDLWFVHWSDWSKLNKDRQDEALRPLYSLLEAFLKVIENDKVKFIGYNGLTQGDYPKFGKIDQNGTEKTIFDSTLSAIHVQSNLVVRKRDCGNC